MVLFEHVAEGGYIASVPLLPGCITRGETFEQTKESIKNAIQGYCAVLKEDGDAIPVEAAEHVVATVAVAACKAIP